MSEIQLGLLLGVFVPLGLMFVASVVILLYQALR